MELIETPTRNFVVVTKLHLCKGRVQHVLDLIEPLEQITVPNLKSVVTLANKEEKLGRSLVHTKYSSVANTMNGIGARLSNVPVVVSS